MPASTPRPRPGPLPTGTPLPVKAVGLMLGLVLFAILSALAPPAGMTEAAWRVSAVAVLMAVWWMTEAGAELQPGDAFPSEAASRDSSARQRITWTRRRTCST